MHYWHVPASVQCCWLALHRVSLLNVPRTIDDIWVVMGKKEGKAYLSLISQMKGLHPVCACILF